MRYRERGSAILIVMLMMVAMAAFGASFLSVSLTDRRIASNEADAAKAFAVAEAGIEDARAALGTTPINPLLTAGGNLFVGSAVGGGTYSVVVSNNIEPRFPTAVIPRDPSNDPFNDTDRTLVLNATGTFRKASRRIETIIRRPVSFFNYGVWCDTDGTFSGDSYLDSYNSAAGPYGGGNVGNAAAFCNGDFTLSGDAQIFGDCTVGDTSCADDHVSGTRTTNAPTQTLAPVACPVGAFTAAANVPAPSTYDAATGVLRSDGNLVLPVPPTSYYFSKVTVSGGNSIAFNNPTGQHVDVYVSGELTVSGGGFVNPTDATKLGLWACGAATNKWTISGGSNARFTIFAPSREVTLSGGSPFYGAIAARKLTNSGGSAIHYDTALASSGNAGVVARTWREIFP